MAGDAIFAASAKDGRLNPLVTLGLAAAGTALVLAGLLFAFSRQVILPLTSARTLFRMVEVPVPVPTRAPTRRIRKPAEISNSARTVALPQPVQSEVLPQLPAPQTPPASKLDLSTGIPSLTAPLPIGPATQAFNPYSDLYQALNSPPKAPLLKNGQTLRFAGQKAITEIAGRCYEEAQLPSIGLSASSGQPVFKTVQCPGEYRPSMDEELDNWANKEKKKLDGNGSG